MTLLTDLRAWFGDFRLAFEATKATSHRQTYSRQGHIHERCAR
ncbi:hypothetical protein N7530_001636 [Penicillium desertorum]|uniref:Uncharacterized protein n=1 Tax=Penicillium desertorum TaxID=1303715 RepID=A0A9X0BWW5_9EURO|nr:hypothetical protein N7530_001636 [Penicillium desertorum]